MQTQKPTLELLTSNALYRDNPTALFHQLCGARPATLLLESADIDSKNDLKSLLLVDSALRITALGDTVTIQALTQNGASLLPLLDAALPAGVENTTRQILAYYVFRRSAPCSMKMPACAHSLFSMPSVCYRGWLMSRLTSAKPCSSAACLPTTWWPV
jgi:anthranilate/para-aminobenzoate synthase component I